MMSWLAGLIYGLTAFYGLVSAVVLTGVRRLDKRIRREPDTPMPLVSVLVAARNEEANIEACLTSLLAQDYPHDRYEVVVVNDRSTDRTRAIVERHQKDDPRIVLLNIEKDPVGLSGKQNALRQGFRRCQGAFILNTDADCVAPPTWISSMMAEFRDDVGLVIGIPLCHRPNERASFFARMQSVDFTYLLNMAIGATGWGYGASCIGNNFAYRRQAFEESGGYEDMRFALTEDAELLRTIHRTEKWKISAANTPGAVIITEPVRTWKQLYRQRARWILGGMDTGTVAIRLLNLLLLYHLILLVSPALFLVEQLRLACAIALGTKFILDGIIASQMARRLNRRDVMRAYLPAEVFFILYSSLIGVASLISQKVEWKGQVYGRRK